jgi:hypothetical protein
MQLENWGRLLLLSFFSFSFVLLLLLFLFDMCEVFFIFLLYPLVLIIFYPFIFIIFISEGPIRRQERGGVNGSQ